MRCNVVDDELLVCFWFMDGVAWLYLGLVNRFQVNLTII